MVVPSLVTTVHVSPFNTPRIKLLIYYFLKVFTNIFVHSLPLLPLFLFFLSISRIHFCTFPFIDVLSILFSSTSVSFVSRSFACFYEFYSVRSAQCQHSTKFKLNKRRKRHTHFSVLVCRPSF